jgi:protein transport protein SEC61 subunit beta
LKGINSYLAHPIFYHLLFNQATQRRAAARASANSGAGQSTRAGSAGSNILQFYTDESPGLQVGPTTVLVASLSFVGIVVLLHIWGKFRM